MDKRWARLQDGIVFEFVTDDPTDRYHESLVFVEAPLEAEIGSSYADGVWTAPLLPQPPEPGPADPGPVEQPPAPAPVYRTTMTPIRFVEQFTLEEQIAVAVARSYVPADPSDLTDPRTIARLGLDILFRKLDDVRLLEIDIADAGVRKGLDFCASIGVLTPERAEEIKLGVLVTPAS